MKSVVLKKYGKATEAFEIKETVKPVCGENDVMIEVECFGLNYAEVMARNGLYKAAPKIPCVLGYEVVGTVCEIGSKVTSIQTGKRVVAFTRFGGYSEYVVTPQNAVSEIENMDAGVACSIAVQYATAYYMAYEAINLFEGDKVMIHAGAGGVGTALIQLCKLKGASVFANAGSDDKLDFMKQQGADEVINYRSVDYEKKIREKLGLQKLDVVFNPIGGATFKKDFRLIGSGGKLVLFGASERSGKKFGLLSTLNFLRKMGLVLPIFLVGSSKSLIGVNMLNIGDDKPEILARCMKKVVELVKSQKLNPQVGNRFDVSEIAIAHDLLESRNSTGKIVVYWNKKD